MALYRKDVLVRPNSSLNETQAINWSRKWVNNFQEKDDNKDSKGNYINYFFVDVFFAKNGKIVRLFSDACAKAFDMPTNKDGMIEYDLLDVPAIENRITKVETKVDVIENTDTQTQAQII